MFYGAVVWDPWLIVAQVVCLQCLYYLTLGIFLAIFVGTRVSRMSLVYFFDYAAVTASTVTGWCVIASFVLSSLAGAGFLLYLVERAKKCLDFSATLYVIHIFICIMYGGWPSSITWWVVNVTGLAVMALLGEYLCVRRELCEIPMTRYHSNMERSFGFRQGKAIEDQKFVETMVCWKISGNFDGENGSRLRRGYQKESEKILEQKLPGHGLKEKPHIESCCKLLKKQYHAIYEAQHDGESSSFGWDDEKKCVTATADVWDAYMNSHPDNSFMRNKLCPYYDQLAIVSEQDRATGKNAEAPADMLEEINRENDRNEDVEESDEDDAETQSTQLQICDLQGEGSSRKTHHKRKRSADSSVSSLKRIYKMFN